MNWKSVFINVTDKQDVLFAVNKNEIVMIEQGTNCTYITLSTGVTLETEEGFNAFMNRLYNND